MRFFCFWVVLAAFSLPVFSVRTKAYMEYIDQWRDVALLQEHDYGIPACITLAQALLESSAGQSELAVNANNHFGIKCTSDWLGDVYRYDDDKRNECFRVYRDAGESFRDHSLFLQRERYRQLYELAPSDYRAWAEGLKECGYATDPMYAVKLVRIIEEYDLPCGSNVQSAEVTDTPLSHTSSDVEESPLPTKKPVMVSGRDRIVPENYHRQLPIEPEEPRTVQEERQLFYLQHKKKTQNGCTYILAKEGDTYASIAFSLNIKERTLRQWNDALGRELEFNDRVYVMSKKRYGEKSKAVLWVHPNETLWYISQREGIQLNTIYELNGLDKTVTVFKTRQSILLRKPQKDK